MPRFDLILSPDEALVQRLANREPENLFITPAFMHGQKRLGFTPCLLGLWEGDEPLHVCLGTYKKGRLSSSIDIRLTPDVPPDSPFWQGLAATCKRMGVWDLTVYAVTSRPDPVPVLGPVTFKETGDEYHLPLGATPLPLPPNTNLRRNLSKAQKNKLVLYRTTSPSVIEGHIALMDCSNTRRRERGEEVSGRARSFYYEAMLEAGAGEFFQAHSPEGVALSSIFMFRSKGAVYYQSAGTSPEGMSLGASPFLIWTAAETLRQEGLTKFCLGGSTLDNAGLVRFKSGFGSEAVPFVSMGFSMAPPLKRKLRTLLRMLKNPREIIKTLGFIDRYQVYAADLATIPQPEPRPELELVKLDDAKLRALCLTQPEFHRQAERLDEFPFNDAWGLLLGDELVHVSWMVSPEHDRQCAERNVKVQDGEVEITHCYTSAAHRGKGLYPHAIRALSQKAQEQGFQRVLMITHHSNSASQQGILKAGLKLAGTVRQVRSPVISEAPLMTLRGHR